MKKGVEIALIFGQVYTCLAVRKSFQRGVTSNQQWYLFHVTESWKQLFRNLQYSMLPNSGYFQNHLPTEWTV